MNPSYRPNFTAGNSENLHYEQAASVDGLLYFANVTW
jgi:hypothetical protein